MKPFESTPLALLIQGLAALGLPLSTTQQKQILRHVELLRQWNKAFNLLGRDDDASIIVHDVLDSLALYRFIAGSPVLDMGSGAGFPGIPLAIGLPQHRFTLLEPNGKKAAFLRQVVLDLQLSQVTVLQARAEQVRQTFHTVPARALASLPEFAAMAMPLLQEHGMLLAMQGKKIADPSPHDGIHHLQVPFLDEQRAVVVRVKNATPL
jgi:16S rRNA (guanine527-N7)-methyltransferase